MTAKVRLLQTFQAQLDAWAVSALDCGASNFSEFLSRLHGASPGDALVALHRLHRRGDVPREVAGRLEWEARNRRSELPLVLDPLPPPHPLDFEWRYTERTSSDLLTLAQTLTRPSDPVLLLGTPGVAAQATVSTLDRVVIFVGPDNVVSAGVRALNDLNNRPLVIRSCVQHAAFPSEAGVVVVDPPWYFDYMRPMLAAAAASCRVGGFVLMSLLPVGTRPGAADDRAAILKYLRRLSLEPTEIRQAELNYRTPHFEANALAAAGIRGIPSDWRRSDLVVLRKSSATSRPLTLRWPEKQWREAVIGRMRLFIRVCAPESRVEEGFSLRSIVPGDILPTVSRRDLRRRRAGIWTSGNRVLASQRPDLVLAAAMHAGNSSGTQKSNLTRLSRADRDEARRLSYILLALAEKEEAEEANGKEEKLWLSENSTSDSTASSLTSPTTVSG
jgi:hypothetical protein